VFSDITMPGPIDGIGLCKWLESAGLKIPVILASGVPRALDDAKKSCVNVQAIAPKPYDQDEIVTQIRAVLAAQA
jgi:CheY-like chemotaxis protein